MILLQREGGGERDISHLVFTTNLPFTLSPSTANFALSLFPVSPSMPYSCLRAMRFPPKCCRRNLFSSLSYPPLTPLPSLSSIIHRLPSPCISATAPPSPHPLFFCILASIFFISFALHTVLTQRHFTAFPPPTSCRFQTPIHANGPNTKSY
jgi:hypothetical protein